MNPTLTFLTTLLLGSLAFPGFAAAQDPSAREASRASAGAIVPLDGPVLVGKPVTFKLSGHPSNPHWDLGDGATADGSSVTHSYQKPGIYRIVMGSKVGDTFNELSSAIVRVHTPETLHLPQVMLDTDAGNEQDDQHYIAYALFSELDVWGINSVHHTPWADKEETRLVPSKRGKVETEKWNYDEIIKVLDLAKKSGLPDARVPRVFRGATEPLKTPSSRKWYDTKPIVTEASEAILEAARGASPDNPVWVVPVGPSTNVANAILQVRREGWESEFRKRIRICWLGGSRSSARIDTWNGKRDAWAAYIVAQSGIEFLLMLEPVGIQLRWDKRDEVDRYPDTPLGQYLYRIGWRRHGGYYDPTAAAAIISMHANKDWFSNEQPATLLDRYQDYRWETTTAPTNVRLIKNIEAGAMRNDIFETLNGRPTRLRESASGTSRSRRGTEDLK